MFIRNAWYVGAWAHELSSADFVARKMLGERVLLYRTSTGEVAALRDRCGHRFAPLSKGRREGDCIRCMYHGLVFDRTGACVEEPGRGGHLSSIRTPTYPVVEKYRLVWVWMGAADKADPALIPDCRFVDDPAWPYLPRYQHFNASYLLLADNLLDFSHLGYVHETTLGGSSAMAEVRPKVEQTPTGLRLTRWYLNEPEVAPYLRGFETFAGPVDRWHIYELTTLGNVFNMDSGSAPAGTGAPEGRRVDTAMQFHSTHIITPEDERSSHFFWSYSRNFRIDDVALTRALTDRIAIGFDEDLEIIEAQQVALDESGGEPMGYILADNALTLGRRLIERRLAEEAAAD